MARRRRAEATRAAVGRRTAIGPSLAGPGNG
jgi:hypothetical protein